jgi:flagellar basal body-associated protein FliL
VFISKRTFIISGIVAVILAGGIGFVCAFAFSQINQTSTQQATRTEVPAVFGTTTNISGQRACILGVVQSISGQTFIVSANQGKRIVTVSVNVQTRYSKQGNSVSSSLADLAVGDGVRVTAQGQCNRKETSVVAQRVAIVTFVAGLTPTSNATPAP